jgi:c-di-GMP-binding flagellar brake protein YcgR
MSEGRNAHRLRDHGPPDDFVVDTRIGIEKLLRAIVDGRRPARVISRTSNERATVRLLDIDARRGRLVFVPLSAGPMHTWLNEARELLFQTDHGGVPIEFTCERPAHTTAGNAETYSVGFPAYMIRLQRRNAYRLPAPDIVCTLCDESGNGPNVSPDVLDLSAGGLDLAMPLSAPPLSRRISYTCTIVLPGFGTIGVRLRIVSEFQTAEARRYGCQFVDLPDASELLLQRYILDEQRTRRRTGRAPYT